jgi:hydrogen peroxide-dependent heme synthase
MRMDAGFASVEPSVGWGVLHLFYRVDRTQAEADPQGGKRIVDAVQSLLDDGHQALVFAVLGHKADLGVMALGPDLARLQQFQHELSATPLDLVDSYLSLTELSEYTSTEDDERERLEREEGLAGPAAEARLAAWRERIAHYQEQRIHPQLPLKKTICFYPMSKRRATAANWYSLPFAERKRLMAGHARVGRTYAGRVLQLITGSTGLDDWEWGVTLFTHDPLQFKKLVYEMRFDPASAKFAQFGPFYLGVRVPAGKLGELLQTN